MTSLPEPPGLDALRREAEEAAGVMRATRSLGVPFMSDELNTCCEKWRALGRAEVNEELDGASSSSLRTLVAGARRLDRRATLAGVATPQDVERAAQLGQEAEAAFDRVTAATTHAGLAEGKRGELIGRIARELDRAYAKHGRDQWGRHEWYAILLEEVEEVWDAVKRDLPTEELEKELVQVAAMCFRYYETRDRYREPAARALATEGEE